MVGKWAHVEHVEVVEVGECERKRRRKGCEAARTDSKGLGHYTVLVRMVSYGQKAMHLQRQMHNAEKMAPGQKVEVGQIQHTVPLPKPHLSTAEIDVPRACIRPFRRQTSCVILEATIDQRASQVSRWQ